MAKMDGRPFVLLGVNGDEEPETIQQASFISLANWRRCWNGGPNGPFTTKYGVSQWPMTVVLDAKGVVRYRGSPGPGMEQAVEMLVREAEGKGKG